MTSDSLPGHLERESDVAAHAHVRIERVGLEHHGEPALRRADIGHVFCVDQHLPGGDVLKTGDEAQKRRLAAAGRPDEHGELAVLDIEIDAVDDADGAERLAHGLQLDAAHGCFPSILKSFHCAEGQASHQLFLREPAEDQDRRDRERRGRRKLGPEEPLRRRIGSDELRSAAPRSRSSDSASRRLRSTTG